MSNEPGDYNPYQPQGPQYPGDPQYGTGEHAPGSNYDATPGYEQGQGGYGQGGYEQGGYEQGYGQGGYDQNYPGGYPAYGQPPQGGGLGKLIAILVGAALGAALLLSVGFIFLMANRDDGGSRVIGSSPSTPPTASAPTSAAEGEYGSDPTLDRLYDSCKDGNNGDCDSLYWQAPLGSGYEDYGRSCAGRQRPDGSLTCEGSGSANPPSASASPDAYGSDPELDRLQDSCAGGNNADCDSLYWRSPLGSDYEEFGRSCGGRGRPDGRITCDA